MQSRTGTDAPGLPKTRTGIPALPFCHRTLKTPVPKPGYPKQFKHLGHYARARRIDLRLGQRAAAAQIGVACDTLRNWESGRSEPEVRFLPALIEFLGHDPFPMPQTAGQAIRYKRLALGMSQQRLANLARVDEATVRRLEADRPQMAPQSYKAVQEVLGSC